LRRKKSATEEKLKGKSLQRSRANYCEKYRFPLTLSLNRGMVLDSQPIPPYVRRPIRKPLDQDMDGTKRASKAPSFYALKTLLVFDGEGQYMTSGENWFTRWANVPIRRL